MRRFACQMMRRWSGMREGQGDGCEHPDGNGHAGDHVFPPPRLCTTVYAGSANVPARRCPLPPGHRSPCCDIAGARERGAVLTICDECKGEGGAFIARGYTSAQLGSNSFETCSTCAGRGVHVESRR